MKIAFLCNPAVKRLRKFPALVTLIQKHVPASREIFLVDRSDPHSLEKQVDRILEGGFDRLAVAGGDGTLNRVVNILGRRGAFGSVTLGIVPFGTCNDFAKALRLSRLGRSLKSLTRNSVRSINVGRVNDELFVNNAGFGKRNPSPEKRSNFQVIREMVPVGVTAQWDSGSLDGKFFMMLCANAPYFSGGLRFSRASNPSDNMLDFFFVKNMPKLNLALRLAMGRVRLPLRPFKSQKILKVSSSRLKLETSEPVSIVVDGEPKGSLENLKEATFDIAGACRFIVPK